MLSCGLEYHFWKVLNHHCFGVIGVLCRMIRDKVMGQLMRHHHAPIYNCISLITLLHYREMQVIKVSVIEEECSILVECNCAAGIIVKHVYCTPFE